MRPGDAVSGSHNIKDDPFHRQAQGIHQMERIGTK
jgi:hypothetical protein